MDGAGPGQRNIPACDRSLERPGGWPEPGRAADRAVYRPTVFLFPAGMAIGETITVGLSPCTLGEARSPLRPPAPLRPIRFVFARPPVDYSTLLGPAGSLKTL